MECLDQASASADGPSASRAFHGWWIVAAGAVLQALGPGLIGIYGFVTTPIVSEFGWLSVPAESEVPAGAGPVGSAPAGAGPGEAGP